MTHSPALTHGARLALVITELRVGGAERCLAQLALRLDKRRFDPVVYSLAPRPVERQGALVDQLEAAGIPVEFLGATSLWQTWRVRRRLQRLLAAQRPDLVQTFLFHANVLGSMAARRVGVPHIVAGVRVADPSRWRQVLERRCFRHVDRVVCVSQSVATFVRDRHRIAPDKLSVIPNGIDVPQFSARPQDASQLGLAPGRRALVVVGRLHRQKGIDWLLHITPRLFQSIPDIDLLIVGHGPDQAQLTSLATHLGVSSRVHFLGWRDDVPSILAGSEMLILPSRWEGMPNVVLEAMATGLPVVATRAEGVAELLGADQTKQLVEFGDSQALFASVSTLLSNARQARECGDANRRRAADCFSLDRMIEQYQALYGHLVGAR